jgi:glutathione-regulated potassium-efflux system ancillary protein KefF
MARVLVIYAHPTPHRSRVNRRLAEAARVLPSVLVQDLYEAYPDFYIEAATEQALVVDAETLVFLHPIQWYSMPALLKEWLDTVLDPGWAYASRKGALRGKRYWLVATTGGAEDAYQAGGAHGRPFAEFLAPFHQTAAVCGMHWLEPHVLHGATTASEEVIEAHVAAFMRRLEHYAAAPPNHAAEPYASEEASHGS